MSNFNITVNGDPTEQIKSIVGENVSKGDILYLHTDSKWYKATAALLDKSSTELSIATVNAITNDEIDLVTFGGFNYTPGTLVAGSKYYLATTPGDITTTLYVNTANIIRYIGTAYSDEILIFNPDQTYISENGGKINNVPLNVQLKPHTHTESDISDLDKYTTQQVDDKLLLKTDEEDFLLHKDGDGSDHTFIDQDVTKTATPEFEGIDLNTELPEPTWKEGRVYYDSVNKCYAIYDDISDTSLQVGQELRIRVFNSNTQTIPNGAAVTVTGVTNDNVVEVHLAIASDKTSALNTIGIATHDIPVGAYGWATTAGVVNSVNTSPYTEGTALWLSDSIPGAYQEFRPLSPSYEVRMGGIIKQDAVDGKIYAELRIIDNNHDNARLLNGTILEDHEVIIIKTPTTTSLQLTEKGTSRGYLSVILNQEYTKVTVPVTIELTNGTDNIPIYNYIYINNLGVLTKDLSAFPTTQQYAPVATIVAQSAASANTYGLYKVHAWTDHLADSRGQGHISHLNSWIRFRPALWKSGIVFSTVEGVAQANIPLIYTSGVVSQLHLHNFPIFDTTLGDEIYGINNPTNPYDIGFGLTSAIDTDSLGNAIGNNKYYTIIVWGVVSEDEADCKVFYNLPSGSYTNVTDALNDIDKYNNYTIPDEYTGTGFLLTQLTLQRTTNTVEVITDSIKDLRGLFPASGGGGGTTGGAGITRWTELIDTPLSIEPLKIVRGNAAGTALEFIESKTSNLTNDGPDGINPYLTSAQIDGGSSASVYTTLQNIDGGTA